jgi:uncharacterized membrane protein
VTLTPLLTADPVIQVHAFAAMSAFGLGVIQLAAAKGTPPHRTIGWIWVALMTVIAVSSFWIHTIRLVGPFSPIHLLSIFTLVMLPIAVMHAHRGSVHVRARPDHVRGGVRIVNWPHPASTARTPSMTNCTASAASRTPRRRESTTFPVIPSSRSMRPAAR